MSNLPPFIVKIARAIPGLVPVTLMEIVNCVAPLTTLPEVGVVKHTVTLYAPEVGVLVAHGLIGAWVGMVVAVGIVVLSGVEVATSIGVGVVVGPGVGLPFENTLGAPENINKIKMAIVRNENIRLAVILSLLFVQIKGFLATFN